MQESLSKIFKERKAGENIKEEVNRWAYSNKLKIRWSSTARNKFALYGIERDYHPLEIADAFFKDSFIGFGSAMYWNDLTDQIPKIYHVATERKKKTLGSHFEEVDDDYLMDQFMRAVKSPSYYAAYRGIQYILSERDFSDRAGIVRKSLKLNDRKIIFNITDKERTILDSIAFPEKSGGIKNVIDVASRSFRKLSSEKLIDYYSRIHFTYPYWQRIGLIFDRVGGRAIPEKMMDRFKKPKFEFFLDRQYRSDWIFDDKWKVYYPKGIFGEH